MVLFLSELAYFLSTDVSGALSWGGTHWSLSLQVREELFVDTSRGEKLRINFDLDFPRMPCVCKPIIT